MKNKFYNLKKRAFTLVELIIVIAVITILAGIVVVAINPASIFANSRNGRRANDINTIQNAIVRYLGDATITTARSLGDFTGYAELISTTTLYGAYASTNPFADCNGLSSSSTASAFSGQTEYYTLATTGGGGTTKVLNIGLLTTASGNYLPKLPTDPSAGAAYRVCIDTAFTTPGKLVVYAVGESVNGATAPVISAVI